jgi:hypothetical protein
MIPEVPDLSEADRARILGLVDELCVEYADEDEYGSSGYALRLLRADPFPGCVHAGEQGDRRAPEPALSAG